MIEGVPFKHLQAFKMSNFFQIIPHISKLHINYEQDSTSPLIFLDSSSSRWLANTIDQSTRQAFAGCQRWFTFEAYWPKSRWALKKRTKALIPMLISVRGRLVCFFWAGLLRLAAAQFRRGRGRLRRVSQPLVAQWFLRTAGRPARSMFRDVIPQPFRAITALRKVMHAT